jgi:hypothetical protein
MRSAAEGTICGSTGAADAAPPPTQTASSKVHPIGRKIVSMESLKKCFPQPQSRCAQR